MGVSTTNSTMLSLVIPVYKNEDTIPALLDALTKLHERLGRSLEVIFVVDGSPDGSHDLLRRSLPDRPFSSELVSLSRNFGSFAAMRTGLFECRGQDIDLDTEGDLPVVRSTGVQQHDVRHMRGRQDPRDQR